MKPRGRTQFGNRKRTKADKQTALVSMLTIRRKPLSPADVESIARAHGVSAETVKATAQQTGLAFA